MSVNNEGGHQVVRKFERPESMLSLRTTRPLSKHTRSYVISVEPPVKYPKYEGKVRSFGERKSMLYRQYTRLLQDSEHKPIIFFYHNDFTVKALQKLRRDITIASNKAFLTASPSLASPTPAPVATTQPTFTVVRAAVFGAALRDFAPIGLETGREIASVVPKGALAVLTLPSFNPPQLDAILRAMDRSVPPLKPLTQAEIDAREAGKKADPVSPGRAMARVKPVSQPELKVLGALIERRVFLGSGVKDVCKLGTLDTLRAQVVGILSSPGNQLAMVLSEGSGGKLARTLEGLKKGLA